MDTARRQYPDEFKLEALELLASSGRPLSQIAGELGIPPECYLRETALSSTAWLIRQKNWLPV
jgi:transposase-like protein